MYASITISRIVTHHKDAIVLSARPQAPSHGFSSERAYRSVLKQGKYTKMDVAAHRVGATGRLA
jgi:hypothetical protein